MKNLFNSASACGNPAKKFIYKGEIMDSVESAEDSVLNVPDYNDVSDVENKFHTPKVVQEDPDVDQDFMAQIEAQETEPPYATDAKEIISIIEKNGGKVVLKNVEMWNKETGKTWETDITYELEMAGFGWNPSAPSYKKLRISYDNNNYEIDFSEDANNNEITISKGLYNNVLMENDEGFNSNIKGLLSDLKKHVGQKDESEGKLTPGMRKLMGLD